MNESTRNQAGQNPEMEMELLKIYIDEWKFRQDSLWRRITQFFVIIFFVSTLPVTVAALSEKVILPDIPKAIFPLCGIALSIFFVWFCFSEAHRIAAIDSRCKEIIKNNFPSDYQKSMADVYLGACFSSVYRNNHRNHNADIGHSEDDIGAELRTPAQASRGCLARAYRRSYTGAERQVYP